MTFTTFAVLSPRASLTRPLGSREARRLVQRLSAAALIAMILLSCPVTISPPPSARLGQASLALSSLPPRAAATALTRSWWSILLRAILIFRGPANQERHFRVGISKIHLFGVGGRGGDQKLLLQDEKRREGDRSPSDRRAPQRGPEVGVGGGEGWRRRSRTPGGSSAR